MSDTACTSRDAIRRLKRKNTLLQNIILFGHQNTKPQVTALLDCLLLYPDVVTYVALIQALLWDETGVKTAEYVIASSTVEILGLQGNYLSDKTYLALAAALRFNTSLDSLFLWGNRPHKRRLIEGAFIDALRVNPMRSSQSTWTLYTSANDFLRLRAMATRLGAPSMLSQLDTLDVWHAKNKFSTHS